MELTLPTKRLAQIVAAATAATPKSSTMEILKDVLVVAEQDSVTICGTDLTVSVAASAAAVVKTPGRCAVPARNFNDIVKSLPGEETTLRLDAKTNRLEAKSGRAVFRVLGVGAANYPVLPPAQYEWQPTGATALRSMLAGCLPAVGTDETRPHLCGVLIEQLADEVLCAATDGHRLHVLRRPGTVMKPAANIVVPSRGVREIIRLLDGLEDTTVAGPDKPAKVATVDFGLKGPYLGIRRDGTVLHAKLMDLAFPPYRQVIPPAEGRSFLLVGRGDLAATAQRITTMPINTLRLTIGRGALTLSCADESVGDASESIEVDLDFKGVLNIGASPRYFREALGALTDVDGLVSVDFGNELDPLKLRGGGDVCVIMPMRL